MGQIEEPINNSKGCGGIMRAALIALCSHMLNMQKLDMHGAKTVAITHGHILGAYLGYDRIEKNYNYVTENDR